MNRWLNWLRLNVDGLVILVLAPVVGVLAVLDAFDMNEHVGGVTLSVLGLLALALLRDRHLTTKAIQNTAAVKMLYGPEIGEAHTEARRDTDQWACKSGIGTYLRAVTLPSLLERARVDQRPIRVQVELIDPRDEQLCEADAQYRASLQSPGDAARVTWTADRVRRETLATILAIYWYRKQSAFLSIEVALSSTVSTLRWDLSSSCVILNPRNPTTPALKFTRDKPHYRDYNRELLTSFEQAHRLSPTDDGTLRLNTVPTPDDVTRLFGHLGIPMPASYSPRDIAEIITSALEGRNRA
ncbi:hypothetical protein [Nocardia huaxiensis]|uniref:Uncharacterized protein n=1 Tax=Nocardia huaxiensis TaxID=2755382 RepID=A0A7D6VJ67_9NOCA|nr:hypothetical protein [Nocardia huaxiensis]QLY31276.1 hypothetical protein H0264_02605 [Nocardia huaxiensis]UFS94816.1 hypothetical protein LPY97_29430 [Nocardia huaxiensis]